MSKECPEVNLTQCMCVLSVITQVVEYLKFTLCVCTCHLQLHCQHCPGPALVSRWTCTTLKSVPRLSTTTSTSPRRLTVSTNSCTRLLCASGTGPCGHVVWLPSNGRGGGGEVVTLQYKGTRVPKEGKLVITKGESYFAIPRG